MMIAASTLWFVLLSAEAGRHERRLTGPKIAKLAHPEADRGKRLLTLHTCRRLFRRQCLQCESVEVN